jgi:MIP family channel proteins
MNFKALVAEFIGTFTLIFIGVGSGLGKGELICQAFAHGLAIAVMVSALGAISGGHFNPAVSFGLWVGHHIKTVQLFAYWVAQVLGAIAGAYLIAYCSGQDHIGVPGLSTDTNMYQGLILEGIGAFFLVTVVYGTAVDKRAPKIGGLAIGLTITISILCFGPLTGSAINPARFLGPAVAAKDFTNIAVYLLGPLAGGGLAGFLYHYFYGKEGVIAEPAAA